MSRERRGRGIGTSIVQRLLGDVPAGVRVFALTLAGSAGWYMERFGFEVRADASMASAAERARDMR